MPWILQMVGFAVMLFGIAIALWVSVWLLVFLFLLGLGVVAWSHVRAFLLDKGIIHQSNNSDSSPDNATVFDAEFTRIDSPEAPEKESE